MNHNHMKTKLFWKIIPLALVTLLWIGCKNNSEEKDPTDTSTLGDDENDFVENQTWSETINIVWDGTNVSVTGNADGVTVTTKNGYVTINSESKHIEYAVSGNGTGQLNIYSDYKFKLSLNGLTLSCSDGPAINNQCKKTCYAVLGSNNILSDGSTYATSTEDRKAAFFSEGQVCISGSGSLNITGNYKHALASDDYIRICEGTGEITLTAKVSDGLHSNDGIIINDGTLTIQAVEEGIQCDTSAILISGGAINVTSTTDKGILAYGDIEVKGGNIHITSKAKCIKSKSNLIVSDGVVVAICTGEATNSGGPGGGGPGGGHGGSSTSTGTTPEAIEAKGTISISGGQVYAQSADDAINSGSTMTISGGYVCAYSTSNDGIDANSDLTISGGVVYAIGAGGAEKSVDAMERCTLTISGGTLVCIGDLENGAVLKQDCYSASSWSKNTWYALTVDNQTFAFKTPASGGTKLVVSGASKPSLKSGVTPSGTIIFNGMAYYPATASGGSNINLSSYSANSGWGGGGW